MIVRDRNHPSIIIWGARLNETPNDTAFYTSTNELAHALATRGRRPERCGPPSTRRRPTRGSGR